MTNTNYIETKQRLESVFEKKLFFVAGAPKSGTTWLERLLDSHPEVVCKGEAHFLSDLQDFLSKALEHYNNTMPAKGGAIAHLKQFGGHTDILHYEESDRDFLTITAIGLMLSKWVTTDGVK